MGELLLVCSGWNYPDSAENVVGQEYSILTRTPKGMTRATPEKFEFSIKVPETVTHVKRLDITKGAMTSFEEFLDKNQTILGVLGVVRTTHTFENWVP